MPSEIIPRDGYRPQVLHALVRKRAEIAGQIGHYQTILRGLNVQLDNVDATIRIFNPAVDIGAIRAKPLGPRYAAARGETSRIVFNMLREANGGPITSHDIVLRLMEERGLNSVDKKLKALFATRVRACLSMHTKAGLVRRGEIVNRCQGWEIEK